MTQHDKLLSEFQVCTGQFPYRDIKRLLAGLGYDELNGKGSGRKFHNAATGHLILFHAPHPSPDIPYYVVKQVRAQLEEKGVI
jgi:predicted RNA binding protein YcfA (HicA-like mRNA interferase family)